jgi:lysophospholipase L1-like esterase
MTIPIPLRILAGTAALALLVPAAMASGGQSAHQATCTAASPGIAVGDSILWMASDNYGQKRAIQALLGGSKATVNANTGRQFQQGISAVRGALGRRPPCAAVVALGTNGPVKPQQWRELMSVLRRVPRVVVVNTYTKDHLTRKDQQQQFWMEPLNREIANLPKTYRNVRVADWYAKASRNSGLLEPDGVHPNPRGSKEYVAIIRQALRQQ